MENKHTIIYVMRHIDIGGHIEIPYKKVGITGLGNATLSSRLQQISNTKSPIKAQCVAAWSHEDAKAVENAIHNLLKDSNIEGEWFLDKENTLVERMQPLMALINAKKIEIEISNDAYTEGILNKELEERKKVDHILLAEISQLLCEPLKSSSRTGGPTFFSNEKSLTYYIQYRKSGNHNLHIGRSKPYYEKLKEFIEKLNYTVTEIDGEIFISALNSKSISEIINAIESQWKLN